jgi:hypothetical protein
VLTTFTIDTGKKAGSAASQLRAAYSTTLHDAQAFADNIADATKRGLDPQIIARLLEAGPKAAGPALQTMVSDQSGRLIRMANQAETALGKIQARVVEQSRLTNLAMRSNTDAMVGDLSKAMAIATAKADSGGRATAEALAKQLHIGVGEVKRIAGEFGISLASGVQSGTSKAGRSVDVLSNKVRSLPDSHAIVFSTPGAAAAITTAGRIAAAIARIPGRHTTDVVVRKIGAQYDSLSGMADGGLVTGRGGPRQDNQVRALSVGEFVVNADATRQHLPELKAINGGARPVQARQYGMAGGGQVVAGAAGPSVLIQISGVVGDKGEVGRAVVGALREYQRQSGGQALPIRVQAAAP